LLPSPSGGFSPFRPFPLALHFSRCLTEICLLYRSPHTYTCLLVPFHSPPPAPPPRGLETWPPLSLPPLMHAPPCHLSVFAIFHTLFTCPPQHSAFFSPYPPPFPLFSRHGVPQDPPDWRSFVLVSPFLFLLFFFPLSLRNFAVFFLVAHPLPVLFLFFSLLLLSLFFFMQKSALHVLRYFFFPPRSQLGVSSRLFFVFQSSLLPLLTVTLFLLPPLFPPRAYLLGSLSYFVPPYTSWYYLTSPIHFHLLLFVFRDPCLGDILALSVPVRPCPSPRFLGHDCPHRFTSALLFFCIVGSLRPPPFDLYFCRLSSLCIGPQTVLLEPSSTLQYISQPNRLLLPERSLLPRLDKFPSF